MPHPTIRVYLRCSTAEQADSGLGLEAQRSKIGHAIDARGWLEPVRVYEDAGHSGATTKRPAYRRLMREVGRGDRIIFARLDRISRSIVDFGRLVREMERRHVALVCLDPELDLSTPNGELVANVLISVAQWERRMTSVRTREAIAARRARGLQVGRHPSTPPAVEDLIVSLRGRSLTLQAICDHLMADEVPTPRGGTRWHPSTVSKVLARRG